MHKILAIDDKKDNLITLSALLKNLMPSCVTITAQSGMEGIERAKVEQPDVILLDIIMPVMDGFETCRRLKVDESTKHIPVIMITAIKTESESRIKGLDLGADAFLSKPIDEAELVSQTKVALRIKKAEDALRKDKDFLEQVVAERTRELRDSEFKYRSMMESITDQLYICSQEFIVEYMNPAMINRLGRDATGETCYRALHDQDHRCDGCAFDEVLKGKTIETTITSPLDNRTYRVTNMPVHHTDGTISKMSIYRDITPYLEAVVQKDKAQAQLLQAQKMESIGTLAGGIAHDFNNILSPIIGFAEMSIEDLPENHPIRENLEDILQGAKRARDLVKQILLFSSQKILDYTAIRIQPVVKEALKLLRASIPANIDIQHDLNEDSDYILGDTTEVHEIIMNLCTNAYHAMEETGGTLKISLNKTKPDSKLNLPSGEYCCLSVGDSGTGISPEIMDTIFEPYFTTKKLGKGTGLGLSVIHGIVKNYKGAITVESRLGKGTVFYTYLPLVSNPIKIADTHTLNKEGICGDEKILFVDDEEPIVKLGIRVLEKFGYNVTGKTSCVEALALFETAPDTFDLVITDMAMPRMIGTKFAEKLIKIRPDIPIIICTGFSDKLDHETAKALGIKDYLHKPILINDLSSKVRNVLDTAKKIGVFQTFAKDPI
jgi:CheY-like chemotaxis protein